MFQGNGKPICRNFFTANLQMNLLCDIQALLLFIINEEDQDVNKVRS